MKHGPNALIDETLPVVCIATQDPNDPNSVLKYEKTLSNIQEVTARSGRDVDQPRNLAKSVTVE
jgi:glucosamine--fructose-6-phosphate aminotransferase (isomerizing)